MSTARPRGLARLTGWLRRWGPLLPLLSAEFIVMLGFGALLPVLPLYVQEQGIDATTLGIIVAAWPIAKLLTEPFAGWWADRHARKPQMVAGLLILGVATMLPLLFTSAIALFVLRFASGVAVGLYDPAARGMIMEGTEKHERGEAFGIYGAFQIGGFVFGPAIGAIGAGVLGEYAFPFILTGLLSFAAALVVAARLRDRPHVAEDVDLERHPDAKPIIDAQQPVAQQPVAQQPVTQHVPQAPMAALLNRTLIAAFVLNFGLNLSFGVYEVIWSLYLIALGATITWVGLTFVLFAVPQMIASPIAGRLVDRHGPTRFVLGGGLTILATGAVYALASEPVLPSLIVPVESVATAAMTPALFAMAAAGTPSGRSSTVQGLYGAISTLALVVAAMVSGALFEEGIGYPFWFFVAGLAVCLVVGLLIYRSADPHRGALQVAESAG